MKSLIGMGLAAMMLAVAGGVVAAEPQPSAAQSSAAQSSAAQSSVAKSLVIYGRLPSMEGATLSPSGNRLAVIRTEGEARIVQIVDFATGKQLSTANVGNNKVRGISWIDEDSIIVLTTRTMVLNGSGRRRSDYPIAALYNVVTTRVTPLLQNGATEAERSRGGSGAAISGMVMGAPIIRMIDGKRTAFIMGVGYEGTAVFRINPANGSSSMVGQTRPDAQDFLIGLDGRIAAESLYNDVTQRGSLVFYTEKGRVTAPLPADADEGVSLLGFSQDGKSVLVAYQTKEKDIVAEITPGTNEYRPKPEYEDNNTPLFDSLTGRLAGVSSLNGDT